MFAKANPKGMALFLHTILCLFNDDEYRPMFSVCWFPYTMVEMKDFKQTALNICMELIEKGKIQPNIVTKATLETASGIRMWQTLRSLSDYAMMHKLTLNFSKAELKAMPTFIQSAIQAFGQESDENNDPNCE